MLCRKGVLKNLFMIFITFKTRDKIFFKIGNVCFLLVHWVSKRNRLILLYHFRLSTPFFFSIFQEKTIISKKCNFFGQTLVFLPTGKRGLYFYFFEYLELRFKGKHLKWSLFLIKLQIGGLQFY